MGGPFCDKGAPNVGSPRFQPTPYQAATGTAALAGSLRDIRFRHPQAALRFTTTVPSRRGFSESSAWLDGAKMQRRITMRFACRAATEVGQLIRGHLAERQRLERKAAWANGRPIHGISLGLDCERGSTRSEGDRVREASPAEASARWISPRYIGPPGPLARRPQVRRAAPELEVARVKGPLVETQPPRNSGAPDQDRR
jgi:hypothetical protein